MTHGALFNGIAGFPLAAAWAGIETTWTCEIDEFCNKVSKKHFPNAIQYTDIRAAKHLPYVDIISGGFPCQPFSVAGKQLAQEDDRHLWPEMLRVIREVKPAYVIGENVTGIISLALDEVLASLEAEGYTTETFIVPAAGVNAPHRRDRVWIIAYSTDHRSERQSWWGGGGSEWGMVPQRIGSGSQLERGCEAAAHPSCELSHRSGGTWYRRPEPSNGGWRLTESPVCGPDDGLPSRLVRPGKYEIPQRRNRAKQLKAYGNAIVPQVAYQFFKAITEIESAKQIEIAA